jgi:hypothetical protein
VVADPDEVLIRGHIPVGESSKVGMRSDNAHRQNTTVPFELTLRLPAPDMGGRGYSTEYLEQMALETVRPG